jgi:hypothetical protein
MSIFLEFGVFGNKKRISHEEWAFAFISWCTKEGVCPALRLLERRGRGYASQLYDECAVIGRLDLLPFQERKTAAVWTTK